MIRAALSQAAARPRLLARGAVLRSLGTSVCVRRPEQEDGTPGSGRGGNLYSGAADYLSGIAGKPETREQADAEAREWLEAIESLRAEYRPNGASYEPSKVFAPKGARDFNIVTETQRREAPRFEPTPEQVAQFEVLKEKAIPPMLDETMDYLANVLMRHGKKGRARRYLSEALYLVYLRTRKDPVGQLKDVLERMAPVVRLKRYSDGGARAEMVPVPMTERQRLRQAWDWILESSDKRSSKAFSVRLGEEIVAAINGRSPGFDKKVLQHKAAITNRAYISLLMKR